jgi:hypothetical protein
MIRVVHSRSRIRILTLSIPDPRSRGQKGTGSWIPDPQYYAKPIYQFHGIDAWGPEKFEIRAQALSPFTQTYVL